MSEAIQRTARLEVGVGHTGLIVHERPAVNCSFLVLEHRVCAEQIGRTYSCSDVFSAGASLHQSNLEASERVGPACSRCSKAARGLEKKVHGKSNTLHDASPRLVS